MFNNSFKLLFFFNLFFSSMISISSMSWFNSWMGLEINLLSFIVLTLKSNNLFSTETSIKYFLIQALASNILLFSIILLSFFLMKFNFLYMNFMNLIMITTLMMKMGVAPFHLWFIQISETLNWINNLILMTWQKIAPLILISYCSNFFIFIILAMYTILIGTIGGLNQISLRKLMAYSSINHLGWMILGMMMNMNSFKLYFFIYSIMSMSVMFMFNFFKIFLIKQFFNKTMSMYMKFFLNFSILSLAGLPPLIGFFPKWIIIETLIKSNFLFLTLYICFFSLFSIFFYIRIMFNLLFLNHFEMKNYFKKINIFSLYFLFFYSLILIFSLFGIFFMNFLISF
uniref:NADH dehydrogenase subunit 2 n=1 Tax=Stenochironomus okialbus TaxID=1481661 RepID=UPI001FAF48C3|nr:NADH dehydrogenase subunit 2 [Stenochironomus okialbus]UKO32994.1 NADH dehydrogenase subunit 2 [Stenochironomus okialbus]